MLELFKNPTRLIKNDLAKIKSYRHTLKDSVIITYQSLVRKNSWNSLEDFSQLLFRYWPPWFQPLSLDRMDTSVLVPDGE